MSTTPFATSHHASGHQPQGVIPARHPTRKFVPAPVHSAAGPVPADPPAETEQLLIADAVLELLRSINRNRSR